MLGFLGPGVAVHQLELDLAPGMHREELVLGAPTASVELLAASVVALLPPFEPPAVTGGLPTTPPPDILGGPDMALEATLRHRALDLPRAAVKQLQSQFNLRTHQDLAFMRGRPVARKGIPAHRLTEDQVTYWTRRLADSRRIGARMIKLVAIYPDLELEEGRPVAYRAEEEAIAFHLPEKPIPPSTIVIARHAQTGEAIQGRFYRE